jgi:broad specificity phosphatase PhoE
VACAISSIPILVAGDAGRSAPLSHPPTYRSPTMLTFVLTRHGLTDRSDPEQHLGQKIDIELSVAGLAQATALAGRIGAEHFDRIIASPLLRARETARAVAGDRTVELDARLAEMDYGRWEGLTYEQIEATDGDHRRRWEADPAGLRCPGGESGDDVAARARSFLGDLLAWAAPSTEGQQIVLAVAHSSLNRVLLCVAMGVPVRDYRRRFAQGQGNLTVIRWPSGARIADGRLLVANDTSHLALRGQSPWELAPGA